MLFSAQENPDIEVVFVVIVGVHKDMGIGAHMYLPTTDVKNVSQLYGFDNKSPIR